MSKDFRELNKNATINSNYVLQLINQMFNYYILEYKLEYTTEYENTVVNVGDYLEAFLKENPEFGIYHCHYSSGSSKKKKPLITLLIRSDNKSVIFINCDNYNHLTVQVAGDTKATSDEVFEKVRLAFPEKKIEKTEKKLKMDFWYLTNHPTSVQREIVVPDWESVKNNYSVAVASEIEELIKLKEPLDDSKLIILNGKPGCGKTFLLRTLLWEWREWATPSFVLDPEALFNSPSYLLNLVLDDEDDDYPELNSGAEPEKKWRVIVLEDADNFISVESKTNNCQAMSRLLNILDGLVGQGLKILFIITANEDEQKIHEAVKRPGRCLANISFEGLPENQAREWLESKGVEGFRLPVSITRSVGFNKTDSHTYTLAELYQILKTAQKNKSKDSSKKRGNSNNMDTSHALKISSPEKL